MQRMHYVMHYVMHRVLAKMGWPSLDRVLSKMAEASLRSCSAGSYKSILTVIEWLMPSGSTSGWLKTRTKRSLSIVRPRGPSRGPGLHKLGCRGPFVTRPHA